jgi:phosphatidylserine decarboxylase
MKNSKDNCMKPTTTEPIAREGFWYVGIAFLMVLVTFYYEFGLISKLFFFSLFLFSITFFRNPERIADSDEDIIIAPCDGRVVSIDREFDSKYFNDEVIIITIRNKILDTHFIRSAFRGNLKKSFIERGNFLPISSEKAPLLNERAVLEFESHDGQKSFFAIMAGSLPSHIGFYKNDSSKVRICERLAFIRSEFRLTIYLPKNTIVSVSTNDRIFGGKSIIGEFGS